MLKNRKFTFIRYIISYLIILLLPIMIGGFAYIQALNLVRQDAVTLNTAILEQGKNTVDGYLKDIKNTANQMALSLTQNQITYVGGTIGGPEIMRIISTQKFLSSSVLTNDFLKYYYIYFKNGDAIVSSDKAYLNPELFYEHFLKSEEMNFDKWYQSIGDTSHYHDFVISGKYNTGSVQSPSMVPAISYMQSIPLTNNLNPKGCIVFVIPECSIKNLLNPVYTKGGGWFYVLDDKGNTITASVPDSKWTKDIRLNDMQPAEANELKVEGQDMIISFTVSSVNGWKYVAVLPSDVVLSKVVYIKRMVVNIVLLILLVGISASVIIAYQNYKPFKKLFKNVTGMLGDNKTEKNEFDTLEKAFTELFNSNRSMGAAMEQQIPLIQAAFFDKLIRGEFASSGEIESFKEVVEIDVKGNLRIIVLIQLNKYVEALTPGMFEEHEKYRVVSKELLKDIVGEGVYIHNTEQFRIMLLFSLDETGMESITRKVSSTLEKIDQEFKKYNINVYYGVSEPFDSLLSTYKAYDEARQAIEYIISGAGIYEGNRMWFRQIPLSDENYYYPVEVQIQLLNMVKSGKKNELNHLIKDIHNENLVKRKLSSFMLKQFLSELRGTVLKLHTYIQKLGDQQTKFFENINTFENIAHVLEHYCDVVEQQKISYNGQLIQNIRNSLNTKYRDPQLSLSSIAAEFGMNESYLSYFFKENTGTNFSAYIENIRIEKACELLSSRNIAVNDISAHVGYNSDQSFRRSFKRLKGISPTEYKKQAMH